MSRIIYHILKIIFIEPCSTEEYINALENIVKRTKIGRKKRKLDIKSPDKPFIKKHKPREPLNPNESNNNDQRNFHKCGVIEHLANSCLKKAKINEITETQDHNDKKDEIYSEKETVDSEISESYEINIINAQINNIDLIYEALNVKSNLPQVGASDTRRSNIQDFKLHRTKPEKGMRYTAGKSSIIIVMVEDQEAKVNLYTGAYCIFVGKCYLQTIIPEWEEKLIPI
ncbi:hypothetical protein O181_114054 [Austropuccinia psidii MF-1]|uniref:Uncharacterized protein n=1 Tax=Austropuccinia psidii MF-1 TaxID=1389203 RepID=A0A9Q3PU96_9BASI|nr:hypothetical protein [Austropuccinia psidii MF-1]